MTIQKTCFHEKNEKKNTRSESKQKFASMNNLTTINSSNFVVVCSLRLNTVPNHVYVIDNKH